MYSEIAERQPREDKNGMEKEPIDMKLFQSKSGCCTVQ